MGGTRVNYFYIVICIVPRVTINSENLHIVQVVSFLTSCWAVLTREIIREWQVKHFGMSCC